MSFDSLPEELKNQILKRLSTQEAVSVNLTSKNFLQQVQEILWRRAGAADYEDFVIRIQKLPEKFQRLILNEQWKLDLAEDIQKHLELTPEQRQEKLLTPEQVALLEDPNLFGNNDPQIMAEYGSGYVNVLLDDNGVIALREKLITPEEAVTYENTSPLYLILSDDGLSALREKLITHEQASRMGEATLNCLFDPHSRTNGLIALREKLITPDQILLLEPGPRPTYRIQELLSDKGLKALREKLITPEQAAQTPNAKALKKLIDDRLLEFEARSSSAPPSPSKKF